uniref:Uncharacterized protein n=1 Tax=Erythrolobus madagascarensis TaxID=708628 RepID=A0A7S0TAY9_9RHOD|mmetsp:Transcript_4800/g.10263  ORF Transcript_4800/g.10263 Transcript_4800/m.10263 type:complete len:117 (+) Transcript_4800:10-360(+)
MMASSRMESDMDLVSGVESRAASEELTRPSATKNSKELLEQKFGVLDRCMTSACTSRLVVDFDVNATVTRTKSLCEKTASCRSEFVSKTLPEIREKVLRKRSEQLCSIRALSTILE